MMLWLHRWVWRDPARCARKLLAFAQTEEDGGRDLLRAAELTCDPLLRRLYLKHAVDEERHAALFRARGAVLRRALSACPSSLFQLNWISPGERGLDDLDVRRQSDAGLLAFLHLSEKSAASHFAAYVQALRHDPSTSDVFKDVLHDEAFHMNYTLAQLKRVAPRRGLYLWQARFGRLWKAYLRVMAAIAGVIGSLVLTVQYFVLLPLFALVAKRAARREPPGWRPVPPERAGAMESQY